MHRSQDICLPIFQIVLKNFKKISFIIEECPEEILIKVVSLAETLSLSVMFENLPVLDGCFCHSDNVSLCTESLNQYSSSFSSINDLKKKNVKIYYFS